LTANCWGPALGAKAVPFKIALVLGVICQSLGVLVFGPEEYIVYGGLLDQSNKLAPHPREAMYSLMWIVVTPVIWQALSIWQKTLVPAYLGTGALQPLLFASAPCVSVQLALIVCAQVAKPHVSAACLSLSQGLLHPPPVI